MTPPRWPRRGDWLRLGALLLAGCALGFAANAFNPHGINVRIALGLPEAAADAAASPAGAR